MRTRTQRRERNQKLAPDELLDVHDAKEGSAEMGAAVGSGVRWMGPTQVVIVVVRLVSIYALSFLLDPKDFGIVALATVVTGFFERVLGDTGTTTAVVRHPKLSQGLASSVLFWNASMGLATSTFFLLAGGAVARLLNEPSAGDIVRVLGLLALVNSLAYVPRALFRRRLMFRRLAAVNLTNAVVTGGATVVFAIAGWNEWSIVIGNLSGSVVATLLAWTLVKWRPSLHFSRKALSEISGFSARLSIQNIFGYVSFAGDRFIIGTVIGTEALGFYGMSNRLMLYPVQTSVQTYRQVMFPNLARIQDDLAAMATAYRRSVSGIALLLFPICATAAAVSVPLVAVGLADKWEPVGPILGIVAMTAGLQSVTATTGSLYNARGRADLSLRWQIASSIVLLVSYVIGSNWGVEGVAWGYFAGIAVLTYPAFAIPLSLLGAKTTVVMKSTLYSGLAAVAGGGLGYVTVTILADNDVSDFGQLVSGSVVSFAVYGLYVLVVRPPALRDLTKVLRR